MTVCANTRISGICVDGFFIQSKSQRRRDGTEKHTTAHKDREERYLGVIDKKSLKQMSKYICSEVRKRKNTEEVVLELSNFLSFNEQRLLIQAVRHEWHYMGRFMRFSPGRNGTIVYLSRKGSI